MTVSVAPLLTTKRAAHLAELPLQCGRTLRHVTIGYETYGSLNAKADNAVLICHYFSGASHAAGCYTPTDVAPGWWDAVIGPGKAIDTERWFVVAIDALGCVRNDAPHGITTGPASLDPDTGLPYGPDFPPVTIQDMVESQREVLAQLGIYRLAAVAGPSLGAMQALTWGATHPHAVDRVIAAIGLAEFQAREIGLYRVMEDAIRLDPAFAGGRYAPGTELAGLQVASKLMTLLAAGREDLRDTFGHEGRADTWAIETWLDEQCRARAAHCDANAWIGMLRANMRWELAEGGMEAAVARIKARVLLIPGLGDELVPMRSYHTPLEQALVWGGCDFTVAPLPARHGHMAGLMDIAEAGPAIRACLETPLA